MLLCVAVIEVANAADVSGPRIDLLVYTLSVWLIIYTIGLSIEATTWYMTVGRYSGPYFRLGIRHTPAPHPRGKGGELGVFAILVSFAVLALAVLVSTVQMRSQGFENLPAGRGPSDEFSRFVESVYYVLSNLTTVGDEKIAPLQTLSRFAVGLVFTSGLVLVTFSLSLLFAAILQSDRARNRV